MTLEKQVCSLELAKKLKELGVKQESLFQWVDCKLNEDANGKTKSHWAIFTTDDYGKDPQSPLTDLPDWYDDEDFEYGLVVSTFTVAELGEMFLTGYKGTLKFKTYRATDKEFWLELSYTENNQLEESLMFSGDTEADVRAEMIIYLLERRLIELQPCK